MTLRMLKALLSLSCMCFYFIFHLKNIFIIYDNYHSIEQLIIDSGVSVAPPARVADGSAFPDSSALPPPPTMSSSCAHVNREPKVMAKSMSGSSSDDEESSDTSGEKDFNASDSKSDRDSHDKVLAPSVAPPVHIGPPKSKLQIPAKSTETTHSSSHTASSQRGRACDIKAVGSSHQSSGASRTHGGFIRGNALGNAPNIGDFDSIDVPSPFVDVEGIVNIFASNTRPTTIDIDKTAMIAVIVPFEECLAPLLQSVARYYSPMSGMLF